MKLRNKKTGKIYTACNICFCESLDDLENTRWKTLKEFCDDWEDVEEPLIKDEKIRKAVRAWAEANLIKNVMFEYVEGVGSYFSDCDCQIRFYEDLHLTDRHKYTLAELCGEEEE